MAGDESQDQDEVYNPVDEAMEQAALGTQKTEQPQQYVPPQQEEEERKKDAGPTWRTRLKSFVLECRRVLTVTKKPDKEEFFTIVKISGLGILAIGLIGFLIHLVKELVF